MSEQDLAAFKKWWNKFPIIQTPKGFVDPPDEHICLQIWQAACKARDDMEVVKNGDNKASHPPNLEIPGI